MLKGSIDMRTPDRIRGWALDTEQVDAALAVRVTVNGEVKFRGEASFHRRDLQQLHGNGNHGFLVDLDRPLPEGQLSEIILCHDQTNQVLATRTWLAKPATPAERQSPLPLMVSYVGRSGSTMMMRLLASAPDVLVPEAYPYEVMLCSYYAQVLHVLTRPGDHEKSMRPSGKFEDPFWVGTNPYYHPQYAGILAEKHLLYDLLGRRARNRIAGSLHDAIVDVYRQIALTQAKPDARYFAEKCPMIEYVRQSIRSMFGEFDEILLVRDIRDVYCSSRSKWSVGSDFMQNIQAAHNGYMAIQREAGARTLTVRYEDMVSDTEAVGQRIQQFLKLAEAPSPGDGAEDGLFRRHATSTDAKASIGRWKQELSAEERAMFTDRFADFFRVYGYET